ncbi:hypothetical protein O7630_31650 [Micromonospora sp. WMMD718]|uniref:hypothetical protein n=1 Tax=Micromonospora sp. WMMD718 TaxID=3016098 RepID=UPI002416C036|nr:hypothetical protein [Micromonospora sp. WMMD718]MDG4755501.1 hypothetical protein [Micromonospora sp. WMMD718]
MPHTCTCHNQPTHPYGCDCCSRPDSPNHRCLDCHRIIPVNDANMAPRDQRWKAAGKPARCRSCRKRHDREHETPERRAERLARSQEWYDAHQAERASRIRCPHCRESFPADIDHFPPSGLRRGAAIGSASCRECVRAERRERRAQLRNDPAYLAEQAARYAARVARRAAEAAEAERRAC